MHRVVFALTLLFLAACGPAPINRADLEAALYQDGDMPAGWSAGQIRDTTGMGAWGEPELLAARDLEGGFNRDADEVLVAVYPDAAAALAAREAAFVRLTSEGRDVEGLGVDDRGEARRFLGELEPEAGGGGVVLLEPEFEGAGGFEGEGGEVCPWRVRSLGRRRHGRKFRIGARRRQMNRAVCRPLRGLWLLS